MLVGVDSNQDNKITWGELRSKRAEIGAHAMSRLKLRADGKSCELKLVELLFTEHSDGGYAVLSLETDQPGNATVIDVEYDLLFDIDPTHRGLVLYENGTVTSNHILSPSQSKIELRTSEMSLWSTFVDYVIEGVWHIWIGLDHVLFLISLLLTAVLVRENKKWEPAEKFWPTCRAVLKIVTVFTLAHSITLWLAVMDYVTLPSQAVEATIAFSIIVVAINNLYPALPLSGWMIAFAFGLVHGFGFANVLLDLGLSSSALAVSLFAFNVGVELGQLAIVVVFFPFAFLIRQTKLYRIVVLGGGSIVIAIIAAIWMFERVFNFEVLGF